MREFLLHIDANLSEDEYIKTILHELVHCVQDIEGLSDTMLVKIKHIS
jgi:predicted metallopeptidase